MRIWPRILCAALLVGALANILMADAFSWQFIPMLIVSSLVLLGIIVQPTDRLERLSNQRFKIMLGLMFGVMVVVQLLVLKFLPVTVYHDPFRVLAQAAQMATGNYDWNITYFWRYAQNVPIAWLLSRWLVVTNWLGLSVNWGVNLLEIAMLDTLIGLTLLTAWQLTQRKKLVLGLAGFFMLTPFAYSYYLQVFYTDLPNMLILLLVFRQLILWHRFSRQQKIYRGLLLVVLTTLGMLIKANLIVLAPAVLLTILIMRPKRSLKLAMGTILIGMALSVPVHAGIDRAARFQHDSAYQFPTIAWVVMGMNQHTQGTYSAKDVMRNIDQKDETSRKKVDQQVLKKRLTKMGIAGVIKQVVVKDGILLNDTQMTEWYNGGFRKAPRWYLSSARNWHGLMALIMGTATICLYLLAIVRLWRWRPQRFDDQQTILMLLVMTALGYLGFHALLWEAEPRYGQAIFPLLFMILMLTKPDAVKAELPGLLKKARPVSLAVVLLGMMLLAWNQGLDGESTNIVTAQRSQLSTQYHARPTYLKPGQSVSQQIELNGQGQYLSVQIHQGSRLKVSLHDQNGQTWHLKRSGDSYHLHQSLKPGTYRLTVANQTNQKQPLAILKTAHYQMADTPLIIDGQVQTDASLIYLVRNYQ